MPNRTPRRRPGAFNINEAINGNNPPSTRRIRQNPTTNHLEIQEEAGNIVTPFSPFDMLTTDTVVEIPNTERSEWDIQEVHPTNDDTLDNVFDIDDIDDMVVPNPTNTIPEGRGLIDQIEPAVERQTLRFFTSSSPTRWGTINEPNLYKPKKQSKDGMVTAICGTKYLESECFYYNGNYYHNTHEEVTEDYFTKEKGLKVLMQEVIETFTLKNGKVSKTMCYIFKKHFDRLVPCYSNKYSFEIRIVDINNIKGWEYKENLSDGWYVDIDTKETRIEDIKTYETWKNYFSGCKNKKKLLEIGELSPSYQITEGLKHTFGVELEVSRGFLPKWKAASGLNVLCIRDGSVDGGAGNGGPEYVTGILTGDTGVNHLQKICQELSRRTQINATCGVHLHLGNINFSQKFLINSYRLALLLEKEIFSTLPKSRRSNRYCKKLHKFNFRPAIGDTPENLVEIEEDYNTLFAFMSVEKTRNPSFEYNKDKQHPLGAKCGYDHNTPRYCWLNYIPAMFNTRQNGSYSLEIRNHQGSTNFTKIKNWLLFFMAFCAFAEKYPELINQGITMKDVIDRMMPKKSKMLNMYFNSRKELFADDNNESKEYTNSSIEDVKPIKELIRE